MSERQIYRILDAAANRGREALRVIEDAARFLALKRRVIGSRTSPTDSIAAQDLTRATRSKTSAFRSRRPTNTNARLCSTCSSPTSRVSKRRRAVWKNFLRSSNRNSLRNGKRCDTNPIRSKRSSVALHLKWNKSALKTVRRTSCSVADQTRNQRANKLKNPRNRTLRLGVRAITQWESFSMRFALLLGILAVQIRLKARW